MKSVVGFLLDRWYGALLCWGLSAGAILFTPWAIDTEKRFAWVLRVEWYAMAALAVLVFAAFVSFLIRRRGRMALKLFLSSLLYGFVFAVGLVGCLLTGRVCWPEGAERIAEPSKDTPWRASEMSVQIPFSLEFRNAHAYLAEYDRRVRFRSGKCASIIMDTGGGGDVAVYSLRPGVYCLVDRLGEGVGKRLPEGYLVDVGRETVVEAREPSGRLRAEVSPVALRYVGRIGTDAKVTLGGVAP